MEKNQNVKRTKKNKLTWISALITKFPLLWFVKSLQWLRCKTKPIAPFSTSFCHITHISFSSVCSCISCDEVIFVYDAADTLWADKKKYGIVHSYDMKAIFCGQVIFMDDALSRLSGQQNLTLCRVQIWFKSFPFAVCESRLLRFCKAGPNIIMNIKSKVLGY